MNLQGILKLDAIVFGQDEVDELEQNNFAVILNGNQTFVIRQKIANRINYFYQHILNNGSYVCFINHKLNVHFYLQQHKIFQNVLKFYQTLQCKFQRSHQVIQFMEIAIFLKLDKLKKLLINDLLDYFDHYGFFIIFQIAQKFNVCPLKQKCLYQLLSLEFQQLNFNKYDLMLCQKQIFEDAIKMHQYYKDKQMIKGLKQNTIKSIISQYCQFNNVVLNIQKILEVNVNQQNQTSQAQKNQKIKSVQSWRRFRTPSFDLSLLTESINFISVKENKKSKSVSKITVLRNKSQVIYVVGNNDSEQNGTSEQEQLSHATQLKKRDIQSDVTSIGSDDKVQKLDKVDKIQKLERVVPENDFLNRMYPRNTQQCCEVTTPSTPDSFYQFPIIQEPEDQVQINKFLGVAEKHHDYFGES